MEDSQHTSPRKGWHPRTIAILSIVLLMVCLVAFNVWRASKTKQAAQAGPQQISLGKNVYAARCASCHGANLEGQPNWQQDLPTGGRLAPPHDASGHTWHHNDESLFATVKLGGQPTSPPGYKNNMPAFGNVISDDEIWAVLAYIKSTWPLELQAAQQQGGHE